MVKTPGGDRAAQSEDALERGFWSSLFAETVIDALSERGKERLLTAGARERFPAIRQPVAQLRSALGDPDLERL
ncbi:hypothetical protein Aple_095700 [Acrocarpospora pleiomorpha]|uniref:Uncharacterized protein n=1 Tax=Acrocarpospora pleiomorpha TaxID=90975 RepID=A0A5M3Y493_9ACTN|nr:hypothetical protein Aple_095700 [Acrocarpospora pleiomorpha]